jgi:hypothetical protein
MDRQVAQLLDKNSGTTKIDIRYFKSEKAIKRSRDCSRITTPFDNSMIEWCATFHSTKFLKGTSS